ncbi:sensor histidine kinase [Asticcacaulis sp. AC402]|uniref:HAMP domain-containing sensor histidine kinase n=1 Tax=Asticcacaulis sp. AC402 TaxID=1282361 RepID=UPI0003C3DF82|nr:sensor histidine kinase [Asticcacaulis sp. AC402]ESQ73445.1 hypothetical protein ABAC402_19250 [Asticcacaulis sp. AC402]
MLWIMWNPAAVSYLAQLALSLAISLYFLRRVVLAKRQGKDWTTLAWLCVTVAAVVPVITLNLLRSALLPSLMAYALPWISPFWAISICAFIQFAYHFPQRLKTRPWEALCAQFLSLAFFGVECVVAVWRFVATLQGDVWFRPGYMDYPVVAGVAWGLLVMGRQLFRASETEASDATLMYRVRLMLWQARGRDAWAARAYVMFTLLPLVQVLLYFLRAHSIISIAFTEIAVTWFMLAMLSGYALVFLNYMPEQSSFQVKTAGGTMTIVLAVIVALSWMMAPAYTAAYRSDDRIRSHQTYRFLPDRQGGYRASAIAYQYHTVGGADVDMTTGRIDLPFEFPFYGKSYRAVFVREDGMAGFDRVTTWAEAQFRYGRQPGIYPLAVELGGYRFDAPCDDCSLKALTEGDKVVVTWDRLTETMNPVNRYSFQVTLYRNGVIDLSYAEVPQNLRYDLVLTNLTAWMVGITPGGGRVRVVSLGDLPVEGSPGTGLMADHYLDFLRYVDRAYAPVAGFLVVAVLLTLILLPAFLRGNLVRPLDYLLTGVEDFRRGDLGARVPVTFHDEIGFLTTSFNEMADAQQTLVDTLEQRVAARTEQIADMTARNARLEERFRLSGDLHDTVSQTLFSAAMLADSLPEQLRRDPAKGEQALSRLGGLSRHALIEMRQLLTDLRAAEPEERPLGPSLELLARDFKDDHTVAFEFDIVGDAALPAEVHAIFHRFAQEALNNIAKHAGASSVTIAFEGLGTQALLTVADNGCGFAPETVGPAHLGLQIMRERANKIGAQLDIVSAPGQGTTLTLIWLPKDEP